MAKEKIMEKLDSLFKEELWGRIEPKDIGISKFKILDDLFNSVVSDDIIQETLVTRAGRISASIRIPSPRCT